MLNVGCGEIRYKITHHSIKVDVLPLSQPDPSITNLLPLTTNNQHLILLNGSLKKGFISSILGGIICNFGCKTAEHLLDLHLTFLGQSNMRASVYWKLKEALSTRWRINQGKISIPILLNISNLTGCLTQTLKFKCLVFGFP